MRIVLLGHREIYSNVAIALLVEQLGQHDLRILLSGDSPLPAAPSPAIHALEEYECQQCDLLDEVAGEGPIVGFAALGQRVGAPVEILSKPNSPAGLAQLEAVQPDLVLSVRYHKILRAACIAIPRLGVLNWHSGLLPQYQGVMATFWAMLNGEPQIGSTIHYIIDGTIDTGPVVARVPAQRSAQASYSRNVLSLYYAGRDAVVSAVAAIARDGKAPSVAQRGVARYYSVPTQADVDAFIAQGLRLRDGNEFDHLNNAG